MRRLLVPLLLLLLTAASAEAKTCFAMATPGAEAEGVVSAVSRRHPNGTPLAGFVITLKSPVCLDDPDALDDVSSVRRIHVVPATEQDAKTLRRSVGRRAKVSGSAMAAHTSYHLAPIVLLDAHVVADGGKT